jgi:transcriptional regulator with XRE-family HTH domain
MPESTIASRFGLRIRSLRLSEGLSQEAFADLCGIHRTYVGAIERGEKTVSIETAEKLAVALGMNLSALFKGI